MDFVANEAGERKMVTDVGGQGPGGDNAGKWSGEATRAGGGFGTEDQKVTIKFGEEEAKVRETKEVPTWMTESTVNTGGMHCHMDMVIAIHCIALHTTLFCHFRCSLSTWSQCSWHGSGHSG